MAIDLQDISLENIGTLPWPIKLAAVFIVAILMLFLGYWLDVSDQIFHLSQEQQREQELRKDFETKQQQAVNLAGYRAQLIAMNKSFGAMLRQLPVSTEVPGLLEDISKSGISSGLEFGLFKPLPERQLDFYAELPIQISVTGSYHQLAEFVSRVAALDRIVTLHDFSIQFEKGQSPQASNVTTKPGKTGTVRTNNDLKMDITAMTYRYTEEPLEKDTKKTKSGKKDAKQKKVIKNP